MACSLQARRRLLLSIIRSPTLSHLRPPQRTPAQGRSLHSTPCQRSNGFSITFGPEIDNLIQAEGRTDQLNGSSKLKTKRKSSKSAASKSVNRSIDHTSAPVNHVSTAPLHRSKDVEHDAVSLGSSGGRTQATDVVPQSRASADEQGTLELSEEAYEVISRPQTQSDPTRILHAVTRTGRPAESFAKKSRQVTRPELNPSILGPHSTNPATKSFDASSRKLEPWQIQKEALKKKFGGEGWNPRKKLSPDAIEGIRALHEQDPERYSTEVLSQQFKVSSEAIRRMLKSKWRPTPEVMEERRARWARRHDKIWDQKSELGLLPPRRKSRRPEGAEAFEEEVRAKQMLGKL